MYRAMYRAIARRRAILAVVAAAVFCLAAPARGEPDVISAPEAHARAAEGALTIIDVRSEAEWQDTGVAEDAYTVTIHNRHGLPAFLSELEQVVGDDKQRPVAFICASGVRSSAAQRLLRAAGYTNVMNIREGMLGNPDDGPGWIARGLPTTRCTDCS